MGLDKVSVRRLPLTEPPIPDGGGRIVTPAGELTQVVNGETFRFLAYIEFKPDASKPRGNHYHANKVEVLYVITGRVRAIYADIATGESQEFVLEAGDLVTIQPNCAHVYHPLEYTQAVELSPVDYDVSDTIACNVAELTARHA